MLARVWLSASDDVDEFTVSERENVLALLVAAAVSTVVDQAARRTRKASRARAEAATLSMLAGSNGYRSPRASAGSVL